MNKYTGDKTINNNNNKTERVREREEETNKIIYNNMKHLGLFVEESAKNGSRWVDNKRFYSVFICVKRMRKQNKTKKIRRR